MNRPIIILGLGRSGTTWLSDIISKYSGGIVLFEPMHPGIYPASNNNLYNDNIATDDVIGHISGVLNKDIRNPWLLRNHLNSDVDAVDPFYVKSLWDKCTIIGFKSIRLNSSFIDIVQFYNARLTYIIRHPLAVISSIINRSNFWEDIGWKNHWKLLTNQITEEHYKNLSSICHSDIQKLAFYWGYLTSKALKQIEILQILPVFYEDLYLSPFERTEVLLKNLNLYSHPIHPAHLFTPSMMTMKTVHHKQYTQLRNRPNSLEFFWKETLDDTEIKNIFSIISKICEYDNRLNDMCVERNYLSA